MKRLGFLLLLLALVPTCSGATNYSIYITPLYDELEEDLYALLYANCTDDSGTQHAANVTFTIDSVPFTWNTYTDRYEGTVRRTTPGTVTYDTIDSFTDTGDVNATSTINQTATVTWTQSLQTQVLNLLTVGDFTGGSIVIFTDLVGALVFNTFIMTALSLAIYSYSGPEATLLAWMLGWGLFSSVVHGQAVMLGLIMLALGGGIILVKLFLDRRTS